MASARLYPKSEIKKTVKTAFKKGNKASKGISKAGNSNTTVREIKNLRKIDNTLIVSYITVNSHLTRQELEKRLATERVTSLEEAIVNQLITASRGGLDSLNFILDRLVGKVTTKVEITKPDPFENKTVEELNQMKRQLEDEAREVIDIEINYSPRSQEQIKQLEAAQQNDSSKEATETRITDPADTSQ